MLEADDWVVADDEQRVLQYENLGSCDVHLVDGSRWSCSHAAWIYRRHFGSPEEDPPEQILFRRLRFVGWCGLEGEGPLVRGESPESSVRAITWVRGPAPDAL